MADVVGTATSSLGNLGGVVGGYFMGFLHTAFVKIQAIIDKWLPPEKRAEWWERLNKFANERPKFAAFILSHIAISGVPLGLFILMTITIAVFAIIVALLIALLGAVLFIVFAVGVALIILLPTLFFTTLAATFLFLWGLGIYYLLKWFNEKKIPGIHTGLVEGLKTEFMEFTEPAELDKLPSLKAASQVTSSADSKKGQQQEEEGETGEKENGHAEGKGANGASKESKQSQHANGNGNSKPPKLPAQGHVEAVGKATGIDAGAVGKTAQGLKQNVPGGLL